MPKKSKNIYWGQEQEEAIETYVTSDSLQLRHKLYEDVIQPAFKKLIENIYWTYSFNKTLGEREYENIEHELIIYLFHRIDKFKPGRGKSFSFFGTITKRWMIQQANLSKRKVPIDDEEQVVHINNISISNHQIETKNNDDVEFLSILTRKIQDLRESEKVNNADRAVIDIIVNLLQNYGSINIYNKKQVHVFLKEGTDLPPRKITKALNTIKELYKETAEEFYG